MQPPQSLEQDKTNTTKKQNFNLKLMGNKKGYFVLGLHVSD